MVRTVARTLGSGEGLRGRRVAGWQLQCSGYFTILVSMKLHFQELERASLATSFARSESLYCVPVGVFMAGWLDLDYVVRHHVNFSS